MAEFKDLFQSADWKKEKHAPAIEAPDKIKETKPDYVLILPWNIKDEITEQISFIRGWGGKFVTFIPKIEVN